MRLIFLIIFLCASYSYGLDKTSFKINVTYDGASSFLEAGYSDSTTLKFDEEYENDLPPFPPPSGIVPTYRIFREYEDREDELIYTDIDLRAEPAAADTTIDFIMFILGNREEDKEFTFQVPIGSLDSRVKEIRVIDALTTGTIINKDISDGAEFEIDNRFIKDFIIRARFEKNKSSVTNSDLSDNIYYHQGFLYNDVIKCDRVAVYSLNGVKQIDIDGNKSIYDLSTLGRGLYIVYIYSGNNVVSKLKIVKL